MKIEQNISRLYFLLELYKLSIDDLILLISNGKSISKDEILSNKIDINNLKRIDKIFNKGLHYYLDPKTPIHTKDASIFFRKEKFNAELNIGAKKIVNHFEEFKISLSAIARLAELNIERNISVFNIRDDVKLVAKEMRELLYPHFTNNRKEFLKSFIAKLAERNILVFEFVETWNKKEKANIDGFFLNPNVIVLKRQQNSLRREIFTLAHELGHFLLNEEEIEKLDYETLAQSNLSSIERWCNDFAYYFLAGDFVETIDKMQKADSSNDYNFELIQQISDNTHLSKIALFTRLLFQNKISRNDYNKIKSDFEDQFRLNKEEEKKLKELEKQNGINQRGGSVPKAINSPLLISTIQTAFHEGIINEFEACKSLNIKPEKLDKYIQ